jgi:hypothetical protein
MYQPACPVETSLRFIISTHARERYIERGEDRKKYAHLQTCKGCPRCVSLMYDLRKQVAARGGFIDYEICDKLLASREVRIHTNNHIFLSMVYEKHGYNRFEYLVHDDSDMLFVVIHDEKKGKVCVTCFSASDSVVGNFVRRPKYRAKQKFDAVGQPILTP